MSESADEELRALADHITQLNRLVGQLAAMGYQVTPRILEHQTLGQPSSFRLTVEVWRPVRRLG